MSKECDDEDDCDQGSGIEDKAPLKELPIAFGKVRMKMNFHEWSVWQVILKFDYEVVIRKPKTQTTNSNVH